MDDKDVFISYSSQDRPFVARLAHDLMGFGVSVWWDQGEMKVGDSLTGKLQDGIGQSRWLAVVLSPNAVASSWVYRELNAALISEFDGRALKVLPILYMPCDIPLFLRDRIYADFSNSYEEGLNALLARVAPEVDAAILDGLLSDSETNVRLHYLRIPEGKSGRYEALLLQALNDSAEDSRTRLAALTGLFTIGASGLEAYLVDLARTGPQALRRRAIFYLGELRPRQALGVIVTCLSDGHQEIRAEARTAHRKITR